MLGRLLVRLRLLLAATLGRALVLRPLDDSVKERALLRIAVHLLWISDDTSAAPLAVGAFIVWVGVHSHVVDSLAVLLVESRGGAALNLELLWRDRIWGFLGLVQHLRRELFGMLRQRFFQLWRSRRDTVCLPGLRSCPITCLVLFLAALLHGSLPGLQLGVDQIMEALGRVAVHFSSRGCIRLFRPLVILVKVVLGGLLVAVLFVDLLCI